MASFVSTKNDFITGFNIKPGEHLNSLVLNRNENKLKDELNLIFAYQKYLNFGDKSRIPIWINRAETYQQDSLVLHKDIPYYALVDIAGSTEPGSIASEGKWSTINSIINLEDILNSLSGRVNSSVQKTSNVGSAILPSGTSDQRDATPVDGMIRYNTTNMIFEGFFNGQWQPLGGGGSSGGGQMFGNATIKTISYNAQTIEENIVVTEGLNGYSVGDVTLLDSYSITVENNAIYKIL